MSAITPPVATRDNAAAPSHGPGPAEAAPNFDRLARPYRWLEYLTFGPALWRCRTFFLPHLLDRRRALVLGDGDGRFLARLLARNTSLHAVAVDLSPAMLRLLRQRCQGAGTEATTGRLTTVAADALSFAPEGSFDLVVTHFFLDCLSEGDLTLLVARLSPTLRPGALWLLSDFHIPPGPLRVPAQLLVRLLYLAFHLLTGLQTTHLPAHEPALLSAGLIPVARQHSLFGLPHIRALVRTRCSRRYIQPTNHNLLRGTHEHIPDAPFACSRSTPHPWHGPALASRRRSHPRPGAAITLAARPGHRNLRSGSRSLVLTPPTLQARLECE